MRKQKCRVLRIYGWFPPSISLGRYQKVDNVINIEICLRDGVGIVRRITGGGALFHDNELTYSVCCSDHDTGGRNLSVKESYEKLNSFIIGMYESFELNAVYAGDFPGERIFGERASFCFSNNEEMDIIIGGKKIGGNAQSRRKGIILQHGSIPIDISRERIKRYFKDDIDFENFTSLKELLNREVEFEEIVEKFVGSFKKTFNCELKQEEWDGVEGA